MAARRKRIPLWVWLVGAFVAFWLGGITYIQYVRLNPPSTGDELLDDYLKLVNRRRGVPTYEDMSSLQSEHGKDPRFWELSANCALKWDYQDRTSSYPSGAPEFWPLKEAKTKGVWNANLQALAIRNFFNEWRQEITASLPAPPSKFIDRRHRRQWQHERARNQSDLIDANHRADRDSLHSELAKLAPDEATTWYLHADLAYDRGDYKGAREFLEKGNRTTKFEGFPTFPAGVYAKLRNDGISMAQSPNLWRAFWLTNLGGATTYGRVSLHFADEAIARRDLEGLQIFYDYLRRGATEMDLGSGMSFTNRLHQLAEALSQLQWIDDSQKAAVKQLQSRTNIIKQKAYHVSPQITAQLTNLQDSPSERLRDRITDRKFMSLKEMRLMTELDLSTHWEYKTNVLPELERLKDFDCTRLLWRDEARQD